MKVKLVAIAALGKNRQIGLNGELPWKIPEEYQHYQDTVRGSYVLVGRKNFEANGGDVEGTTPLVLTRDQNYQVNRGKVFHQIQDVLTWAQSQGIEKIYVIGGAEIYRLTLSYLSEFLVSIVDYDGPADTYFPEFEDLPWKVLEEENHPQWRFKRLVKTPEKA